MLFIWLIYIKMPATIIMMRSISVWREWGVGGLYMWTSSEKRKYSWIKVHFLRCFSLVICLLFLVILHESLYCRLFSSFSSFCIHFLCIVSLYRTSIRTPEKAISKQNLFSESSRKNKSKQKRWVEWKIYFLHAPVRPDVCVCVRTFNAWLWLMCVGMCTRFEDHKHLLFSNYMIWAWASSSPPPPLPSSTLLLLMALWIAVGAAVYGHQTIAEM